jgi:hypothetical protein
MWPSLHPSFVSAPNRKTGTDPPRWVLVSGLMVHLHLYEVTPDRATTDVDALVDVSVRAAHATDQFAHHLQDDLHMRMDSPDAAGVGHRFTKHAVSQGPRDHPVCHPSHQRSAAPPGRMPRCRSTANQWANESSVSRNSWKPACRSFTVLTSAGGGGRLPP